MGLTNWGRAGLLFTEMEKTILNLSDFESSWWIWKIKSKLRVCLIHEYVENMQFVLSKLGVCLIHECVLYTRRYGTSLSGQAVVRAKTVKSHFRQPFSWCYWTRLSFVSHIPEWSVIASLCATEIGCLKLLWRYAADAVWILLVKKSRDEIVVLTDRGYRRDHRTSLNSASWFRFAFDRTDSHVSTFCPQNHLPHRNSGGLTTVRWNVLEMVRWTGERLYLGLACYQHNESGSRPDFSSM